MVEGHLYERPVRKDPGNLPPKRLIHSIVVIGMEKASVLQIPPQDQHFLIRKQDVSMTGHIDERHVPEIGTRDSHDLLSGGYRERRAPADFCEQVRKAGRVGIPIPTAAIMEAADRERGTRFLADDLEGCNARDPDDHGAPHNRSHSAVTTR